MKDENRLLQADKRLYSESIALFVQAVRRDELDSRLSKRTRRAIDQIFIEYHDESTASALRVWKFNRLMRQKKGGKRTSTLSGASLSLRFVTLSLYHSTRIDAFFLASDIFSSTDRKALSIALFTKLSFGVLRKAFPWRKSNACRRFTRCTFQIAGHPTPAYIYIHSYIQTRIHSMCTG